MKLSIDPAFQSLMSLLTPEERAQLETNLLVEGCRDAFAVWAGEPPVRICQSCPPGTLVSRAASDVEVEAGAVVWRCDGCGHIEHRPWTLLDGHTRHPIVTSHGLPFEICEVEGVHTRAEAMKWIIDHQFGRRNLSEEQKSYLRGLRYNLEKRQNGGHGDQRAGDQNDPPTTAQRLAAEYRVGEATIKRDGQYANAVDTLTEALGPEVRQEVLAGRQNLPKRQVVKSAQAVRRLKHRLRAEDFTFMRGLDKWHQTDAITLLARLPADEHALVNALLDQPGLSAKERLEVILRRLPAQSRDARQRLYEQHASEDPRDRARALHEAAGETPILLPSLRYLTFAGAGLQRAVENLDQCLQLDPMAPWSAQLQTLITQIQALQGNELVQVVADVEGYFARGAEADIPADETVDDTKDRDDAVDLGMPELEVDHESAAASILTTSIEPVLDSESQASAALENEAPACGWRGSTRTWRAEASGRIHCDHCHAVYHPATGDWDAGERVKHHATSALGAGLGSR